MQGICWYDGVFVLYDFRRGWDNFGFLSRRNSRGIIFEGHVSIREDCRYVNFKGCKSKRR